MRTSQKTCEHVEVITKPELARLLKISVRGVSDLVKYEGLPQISLGRSVRYRRQAVERWLESREEIS